MTNREFFEAIINGIINDEIKAHAEEAIKKMDVRNEKRAGKPSKSAIANAPIKEKIHSLLYGQPSPMIATAIAEELNVDRGEDEKLSTAKVSSLCVQLVKEGILTSEDVKVKGKGKVKGYTLA